MAYQCHIIRNANIFYLKQTYWTDLVKQLSERFNHILLNANVADRAMLISLLVVLEFGLYLLWALVVLVFDSLHAYVDMSMLSVAIKVHLSVIAVFLCFAVLFRVTRHHTLLTQANQLVMVSVYMVSLFILGYSVGYTSIMTGVSLIGTSVLALMLLERVLVYVSLSFSCLVLFALFFMVSLGHLEDAPMVKAEHETSMFWMISCIYFVMPKVGAIFLMVDRVMHNLQTNHDQLDYLSRHDALTGLLNRRSINTYIINSMRHQTGIAIVLLDLDFFKDVNDTFGHQAGDKVLVEVAHRLQNITRRDDRVSRYGGEEYLMVLPHTTEEAAFHIAERLRQDIERTGFYVAPEQEIHLTASFGVAALSNDVAQTLANHPEQADKLFTRLFEQADKALYTAKSAGRNQVSRALSRVY